MKNVSWDGEISKLAVQLIRKPGEFFPAQHHPCPVCQNPLKIQIGRYQRGITKMIGITIECDVCQQAIAEDFIEGYK